VSVTRITKSDVGVLPWLTAAVSLLLAFAVPTVALLVAMHFGEIGQPTVAQLRAKRMALLAVAAPTLFTFVGVVLSMLGDPVPDTWFWVACWVLVVVMLFSADRNAPAPANVQQAPAALRVAHGHSGTRHHRDLPGTPHYQPSHLSGRPQHLLRRDADLPSWLSNRGPGAGSGHPSSLPDWNWALSCLAAHRGAERQLPYLSDRFGRLSRVLRAWSHEFSLHLRPYLPGH